MWLWAGRAIGACSSAEFHAGGQLYESAGSHGDIGLHAGVRSYGDV